ncbi:MAG TPA: peroxiredoxin-like family protein [Cyclobacteriaceae bacterium]|jgi:peroxiredoxin|nr:peroxiredoxin-like family protein [Cyclobacteriaceae bacterium]
MKLTSQLRLITGAVLLLISTLVAAQDPHGLQVNQSAPDFSAKDQYGKTVTLKSLLKKGNVLLVFYRGEWCPYCNKYLKELEESLLSISAKGASVVAVTPEIPEYVVKSVEKTKATFPILHDESLKIMKSYDVAYKLDDKALSKYKKIKVDLNIINGPVNSENLPVPAVYIINQKGIIVYRFFDPDYTNRAPISSLMKYL